MRRTLLRLYSLLRTEFLTLKWTPQTGMGAAPGQAVFTLGSARISGISL